MNASAVSVFPVSDERSFSQPGSHRRSRDLGADRIPQVPPPPLTAPVATVAPLTTVPRSNVVARTADATWAARRLARSAAYERRPFFDLYQRSRFALAAREDTFSHDIERREEDFLARLLGDVQIIDVHAPFPTDSRRVADAILRTRR